MIILKEKPKPTTLVKISEEITEDVTGDIPKKIHKIRKFRKPKDSKMPELSEIKPDDIIEEIEEIVGEEILEELPQKRSDPKKTIIKRRLKKPNEFEEILDQIEIEEYPKKQKKIIVRKYRQRPEDKKPKLLEEEKILQEKIIEIPSEESEKWKKILFRRKLKPGTVETEFILEKNVMEEIAEVTSEEIVELPCQDRPEEPKKLIIRSTVKQPDGTVEIMERPADKSMIMESVDGKTKLKIIRRPVVQFDSDELFEFSMEKLEKMKKVVESKKPEEVQAISREEMTEKTDEPHDVIIQEELISEETTKEIKEPGKPKKIITIRKVKRPDNEEEEIVEQITEVPDDQDRKPKTMIIRKYRPESPKQQQMITEGEIISEEITKILPKTTDREKVKKLTIKRQIRRPDGVDETIILKDVQEEIVEIPIEEIIEQPVKDKIVDEDADEQIKEIIELQSDQRKKLIIKRRKSVETVDVIDEELIETMEKEDSEDKKLILRRIIRKSDGSAEHFDEPLNDMKIKKMLIITEKEKEEEKPLEKMEIISEQIVELPLDKQIEKSKKIIFERKLRKPDGKELIEMKDVTEESAVIVDEEIIELPIMVKDKQVDNVSKVEKPKKLILKRKLQKFDGSEMINEQ
uniref:Titin-like n=1 Tax=Dermatophagoides pteronyssinus TaxID=6956 RepID=A0A6P6XLU3_DERPT